MRDWLKLLIFNFLAKEINRNIIILGKCNLLNDLLLMFNFLFDTWLVS